MTNKRFQSSDAWIFLSLSKVEEGTTLEALLAKADWINHAILTAEEIEGAVNRLSAAGLVKFEGQIFFLTESGRALYKEFHDRKGSMLTLWKELEKHLNQSDFPVVAVPAFKLAPHQLAAAVDHYLNKR